MFVDRPKSVAKIGKPAYRKERQIFVDKTIHDEISVSN